jgi:hypothetical protein
MISFGITNLANGNRAFGSFLIIFGAIAYYFPTWILERYTKQLKKKKEELLPF